MVSKMMVKTFRISFLVILITMLSNGLPNVVFAWQSLEQRNVCSITNFEFIEDTSGVYDFETIISNTLTNQFQKYTEKVISLGITKSVYWIRFRLPHNDDNTMEFSQLLQLNNPNIDKIDVFIPVADNSSSLGVRYFTKAVGVSRPSTNMDVWDNTWVFSIPRQFCQDQFVYLRLESSSALRLPILLWRDNSFISQAFLKNLGFGIFYGTLFAMFLYNLFIFFVLRDKAYLFYILYIGFMLLYQLQVHGHLKLWLNTSYQIYNSIFWVGLAATFISSIYFTCNFLQVHNEDAPWSKIIKALVGMAILQGFLGVLGYNLWANQIAHGLGLVGPLLIMGLAAFRFHQGFKPARYYLLAWGMLSVGIVVWVLAAYIPDTFSAVNYLMVATASESILLSFALSDRFKTIRMKESAMRKHIQYYRDLSLTDELTGLYNKRYLKKKMKQEVDIAHQNSGQLTLVVIDIDHFKTYNDRYGHWEGDRVLVRLGEVLLTVLESWQLAFRYGGEEFVILLPNMSCKDVMPIAESIRKKFQEEEFMPASNIKVTVSVSIGLAELKYDDTVEMLFQRADDAMYTAKTTGRNRVYVYNADQVKALLSTNDHDAAF